MSQPHTHACPSCGAPLVERDQVQAHCSYCGNYVGIDEDLSAPRTSPPAASLSAVGRAAAHTALGAFGISAFLLLVVPVTICLSCCWVSLLSSGSNNRASYGASARPTPTRIVVEPTPTVVQPTPIVIFGGEGTGPGRFDFARHIAIDGKDYVYVSDYGSLRVQRFDENGKYLGEWSIEAKGKFTTKSGAEGLAADRAGNVYVVWTGLILKHDGITGKLLDTFAGEKIDDSTRLTEDFKSIAVGPDGGLWAVSDMHSSDDLVLLDAHGKVTDRIKKAVNSVEEKFFASSNCELVTLISPSKACPPPPGSPENLRNATEAVGTLYVVHRSVYYPAVFKFTAEGKYLNQFGSDGNRPGQFSMVSPPAIAADSRSRIYVADDNRIQIFDEDGRYLDVINTEDYADALGIAVNSENEIYMVNGENLVFKFPPLPK